MALRKPQIDALNAAKKDFEAGLRRIILSAATGFGKTVVFSNLPTHMGLGGQMFVLAHREELIAQAADKIAHWNPTLKVGIEMAEQYADLDCDVIVSSVATLGRAGSGRINRFDPGKVKMVVVDECHHSVASTYLNIFEYFGLMADNSDKLLVGVTATTGRADGQGLSKVYQKVSYQYSMRQAIEEGWLVDVRAMKLRTDTSLDGVKISAGDFQVGDLADTVNNPRRNQQIVKAWKQNASKRQTIAFTVDIQHAKDLAAMFEQYGIKAAAVWGDDPDRKAKLELHRRGAIQVLCNCGVLTEGYDDWQVSCVIMARPTKSQTLFVQCIGRGTRLEGGTGNLLEALRGGLSLSKTDCIVIDVVDSTSRHSLITVPSIFGMGEGMDLKGKSALQAVKTIEEVQLQHPDVDFSKLGSLDDIEATVEAANIWEVKFPEVVEQNSTMSWHQAFDGSFMLNLPNEGIPPRNEKIVIKQNVLEKWEISATINGQKYLGVRETIEEAFICGDNLLMRVKADAVKLLAREAEWHDGPASDAQIRMLTRMFKGRTVPTNLSKGAASKLISRTMAARVAAPAKALKKEKVK